MTRRENHNRGGTEPRYEIVNRGGTEPWCEKALVDELFL